MTCTCPLSYTTPAGHFYGCPFYAGPRSHEFMVSLGGCTCRWTFRLGQAIRFPDPNCPTHGGRS